MFYKEDDGNMEYISMDLWNIGLFHYFWAYYTEEDVIKFTFTCWLLHL
jgi:hypothetical protein